MKWNAEITQNNVCQQIFELFEQCSASRLCVETYILYIRTMHITGLAICDIFPAHPRTYNITYNTQRLRDIQIENSKNKVHMHVYCG